MSVVYSPEPGRPIVLYVAPVKMGVEKIMELAAGSCKDVDVSFRFELFRDIEQQLVCQLK
jgi:hypothetical protein